MTPIETAFNQAFQIRWQGTEYGENSIKPMMDVTLKWFKQWDLVSLDGLSSGDIVDYQTFLRNRGCSPSQINKYLSMLAMVLVEALRARPPLTTNTIQIPRVKVPKKMQWWLRPEQLDDVLVVAAKMGYMEDIIKIMVHNGLRVREVLALTRDMIDLNAMTVQVPGTKSRAAARTIPIYPKAVESFGYVVHWGKLETDYPTAAGKWNQIKEKVGITHKDATLRALRRTFAAYATSAGMPTAVLKDVMGHENITTTERYLNLVGNGRVEESRRYMAESSTERRKYMGTADTVLSITRVIENGPVKPLEVTNRTISPNYIHTYDGVQVTDANASIVNLLEAKGVTQESILQVLKEING